MRCQWKNTASADSSWERSWLTWQTPASVVICEGMLQPYRLIHLDEKTSIEISGLDLGEPTEVHNAFVANRLVGEGRTRTFDSHRQGGGNGQQGIQNRQEHHVSAWCKK